MTDDTDERAVIELEPVEIGTGAVAENGMLYVGRQYAGQRLKWAIEPEDEDE